MQQAARSEKEAEAWKNKAEVWKNKVISGSVCPSGRRSCLGGAKYFINDFYLLFPAPMFYRLSSCLQGDSQGRQGF